MWNVDHWDSRYAGDSHPLSMTPHDYMFRQRDEVYKRVLPRGAGRRILEVGAAPGDWMVYFYWQLGLAPTGIDFAPAGAAAARRKLHHYGVPGQMICADFLTHDFGDERFDVVFFQGSLEHFPDPQVPLGIATRLCRPGGMVVAQIPCFDQASINHLLGTWFGRKALDEHYMRDQRDMGRALERAGLRDVRVEALGTYQLVVEPDEDLPLLGRAGLKVVRSLDRVVRPLVSRLNLRRQTRAFSPHLIAYGRLP